MYITENVGVYQTHLYIISSYFLNVPCLYETNIQHYFMRQTCKPICNSQKILLWEMN